MPNACLCYFIDAHYLFPTLVSALQARAHLSSDLAEVVIVCVGGIGKESATVRDCAERGGIRLLEIDRAALQGMHPMWGRMFLHQILPAHLTRILYLDGDTQITGSLEPLFRYELPAGEIVATRDPILDFVRLGAPWARKHREHCERIGFAGPPERYCNSGLLLFHREDWPETTARCLELARDRGHLFVYPDQDALNLAVPERIRLISNRWNFPGFLMGTPAEAARRPVLYHFFSNPRPWLVAAPPWGERGSEPYAALLRREPGLRPIAPSYGPGKRLRYQVQQRVKLLTEYGRVGKLTDELPVDIAL